ncbi:MAG: hypothetical protein KY475_14320 [Planctomycetes bacterium]|nr:hypothetical protein [Planctomycetota bacterium]
MDKARRVKLHFGPYKTPRFRYGSIVEDALRGEVRIVGLTDGRIPWPVGVRVDGGSAKAGIVLYRGLAKAVQKESNQAVAYWWGVTGQTVTRWRHALEVQSTTAGTSRLRAAHFRETSGNKARRAARAKSRNPAKDAERRAKIAAAKRGKPRPAHVHDALRKANAGRPLTEVHRRKLKEIHRARGTRPPWLNPAWTEDELELLRTLPPAEVARRTGRTLSAVYSRRRQLGLRNGRTTRHRVNPSQRNSA